jgi:hypothetical protein
MINATRLGAHPGLRLRYRAILGLGALCLAATSPSAALAQRTGDSQLCRDGPDEMKAARLLAKYEVHQLPHDTLEKFRACIRLRRWGQALQTYFGTFRPDLPDWLVYIDSGGHVTQTMFHGGGGDSTAQVLTNAKYVWIVVWSDRRPCSAGRIKTAPNVLAVSDTTDLRFSRRALVPRRDPALAALTKGMTRAVGLDVGAAPMLGDSSQTIDLQLKSADAGDSLYGGTGRFGLVDNAKVELTLAPVRGKAFVKPDSQCPSPTEVTAPVSDPTNRTPATRTDSTRVDVIFTELLNKGDRRVELAVIAGATWGTRIPTYDANLRIADYSPRWSPNAYLSVVWNVYDGRNPHNRTLLEPHPLGVFGGLNVLRGNLGDEWIAGGTVGNLVRTAGIALGVSFTVSPTVEAGRLTTHHVRRLLFGTDLRF